MDGDSVVLSSFGGARVGSSLQPSRDTSRRTMHRLCQVILRHIMHEESVFCQISVLRFLYLYVIARPLAARNSFAHFFEVYVDDRAPRLKRKYLK